MSAVAGRAEMTRSPRVVVVFAPFRSSQVLRSSCARALAVPCIATHGALIELPYNKAQAHTKTWTTSVTSPQGSYGSYFGYAQYEVMNLPVLAGTT